MFELTHTSTYIHTYKSAYRSKPKQTCIEYYVQTISTPPFSQKTPPPPHPHTHTNWYIFYPLHTCKKSKAPTAQANRYVDIRGLLLKTTFFLPWYSWISMWYVMNPRWGDSIWWKDGKKKNNNQYIHRYKWVNSGRSKSWRWRRKCQ